MSADLATTKYVCDSAMDLLMIEMVAILSKTHSETDGEDREAAYAKLELLGYRVGMGLVESNFANSRATRDKPRFADNLDIIKFICKDFWLLLFNKQIDNLKTNHRGVYVLTDNNFRWFVRMAADIPTDTAQLAVLHTAFPCGLIRGALSNLGVSSIVLADVTNLPQCTFQIKFRLICRLYDEIQRERATARVTKASVQFGFRASLTGTSTSSQPSAIAIAADRLHALTLQQGAQSSFKTVVGDTFTGKEAFVNAILENSQVNEIVAEKKTLSDAFNDLDFVRVSYAPTYSSQSLVEENIVNVKLGLDWLQNYNTDVVLIPSVAPFSAVSTAVAESDLTILVTNANAPLSTKLDSEFIEKFGQKPNLLIAANSIDTNEVTPTSDLNAYITARLKEISAPAFTSVASSPIITKIPVFPINTTIAHNALQDPSAPSFTEKWTRSGIQDIKSKILSTIHTEIARTAAQTANARYAIRESAILASLDAENAIEVLDAVKRRVHGALAKGLAAEQDRLRRGFLETDLISVGDRVRNLVTSVRKYFEGIGISGLIVGGGGSAVAAEVGEKMNLHGLEGAEFRMTYAVGKLNEGLYTLYSRTRAELASFAENSHALSAFAVTKGLQADIGRIIDILDKQAPSGNGVQVDVLVLKNLVANGFKIEDEIEKLQNKADSAIRSLFSSQVFFIVAGVFATYLGVPWAISIPSTGSFMTAGVGFAGLRWRSVQDQFLSRISQEQKTLESRLIDTYDREFTRVVADPLSSIVNMLDNAVEKRLSEAKETKAQIDALIKDLEDGSQLE
ncbi:Trafficking protein particle complex subunit 33 [Physocladia obscura]|uniref:Trafficking protein particle complex subunit 33 n=1 Tax=Physocladia obscura TaxID=109957 RepID=A0AAD5SZ93_9FUNG|nr:Trafficking protein particle complex subunit 33 [Physocladia obscura]